MRHGLHWLVTLASHVSTKTLILLGKIIFDSHPATAPFPYLAAAQLLRNSLYCSDLSCCCCCCCCDDVTTASNALGLSVRKEEEDARLLGGTESLSGEPERER